MAKQQDRKQLKEGWRIGNEHHDRNPHRLILFGLMLTSMAIGAACKHMCVCVFLAAGWLVGHEVGQRYRGAVDEEERLVALSTTKHHQLAKGQDFVSQLPRYILILVLAKCASSCMLLQLTTRTTAGHHATPERSSKCRCSSPLFCPYSCRTIRAVFV